MAGKKDLLCSIRLDGYLKWLASNPHVIKEGTEYKQLYSDYTFFIGSFVGNKEEYREYTFSYRKFCYLFMSLIQENFSRYESKLGSKKILRISRKEDVTQTSEIDESQILLNLISKYEHGFVPMKKPRKV